VYNAHNKKFKYLLIYIFYKKKFIKNSNILKKHNKSKKYAKYIKNIPIYMQKIFAFKKWPKNIILQN